MIQERRLLSLAELNLLDQASFTNMLGHLFEHTPIIAERTWLARPFASIPILHQALLQTMYALSAQEQMALITVHPDLAGRAAIAGDLTADSANEQAMARLDQLTPAEYARFQELNQAYRTKFGFPFIICVREHTRASILDQFGQRIALTEKEEMLTALGEIGKIAGLRLADIVQ